MLVRYLTSRNSLYHSPPCSAKVKNASSYISTHQFVSLAWYLVKHRDFTLLPFFTTSTCKVHVTVHTGSTQTKNYIRRNTEFQRNPFSSLGGKQVDSRAGPPLHGFTSRTLY